MEVHLRMDDLQKSTSIASLLGKHHALLGLLMEGPAFNPKLFRELLREKTMTWLAKGHQTMNAICNFGLQHMHRSHIPVFKNLVYDVDTRAYGPPEKMGFKLVPSALPIGAGCTARAHPMIS